MALPHTPTYVSPFDVITSQAENETQDNIVALSDGTGLNNGAVTASKIDFTTMPSAFGNTTGVTLNNTQQNIASYTVTVTGKYLVIANAIANNNGTATRDFIGNIRIGAGAALATGLVTVVANSYFVTIPMLYVGDFTAGQVINVSLQAAPATGVVSDARGQWAIARVG